MLEALKSCLRCDSTDLKGPIFGSVPGGGRRVAVIRCANCRGTFDATEYFGTMRRNYAHSR
jgi:hypothetical protein